MANTNSLPTLRRTAAAVVAAGAMTFKGLSDWIEVFRAGTHVDSKGRSATFTQEDLDEMVANVSGAGVPFVVGHPQETDPAYAWAKPGDVKREGDSLFVKASDVNPAFASAVDSGAYRERSISIVKDPQRGWVPRHVGWLGAVPPAVTGMAALSYSAADAARLGDDAEVFDFMDEGGLQTSWAFDDLAQSLRSLREWLIAEKGLDEADRVLPDYRITSVSGAAARIREAALVEPPALAAPAAQPVPALNMSAPDIEQIRQEAANTARAEEALRFAAQGQELAELRAARQADRIGVQINSWMADGLVLPGEAAGLAEFMAALEGGQGSAEFSFSAPDKSTVKRTPAQWFSDFVAGRKALVRLGRATAEPERVAGPAAVDTSDYRALSDAAQTYMADQAAKGRVVSIAEAVAHVGRAAADRS